VRKHRVVLLDGIHIEADAGLRIAIGGNATAIGATWTILTLAGALGLGTILTAIVAIALTLALTLALASSAVALETIILAAHTALATLTTLSTLTALTALAVARAAGALASLSLSEHLRFGFRFRGGSFV